MERAPRALLLIALQFTWALGGTPTFALREPQMIEPGPLLFGIVVIIVMLLPGMVTVAAAWLLARKVGPRLAARQMSPRSIILLSLVPATLIVVCIVAV